jgi:hypothetical protein
MYIIAIWSERLSPEDTRNRRDVDLVDWMDVTTERVVRE